jgi:hypothetical protein
MTEREKFEAWWVRDVPCEFRHSVLDRQRDGDGYLDGCKIKDAWEAWQSSRRAALEEAAQIAHGYSLQAEKIIRALSQKTAQGEKNG